MTHQQWVKGRMDVGLTQVKASQSLGISQPYLSQLENGSRQAGSSLVRKAASLYRLPTALPWPKPETDEGLLRPDDLERELGSLGYPGFAHLSTQRMVRNPAWVVLNAIVQNDLDTRLVEALPWVMSTYEDMDWESLRNRVKLRNAQNRLGYVLHLAKSVVSADPLNTAKLRLLEGWERDLEEARLAKEGTLCRESMPQSERAWLKQHRPHAAEHWNLLTGLTPEQLSYAK